jgi:hypothetical protein
MTLKPTMYIPDGADVGSLDVIETAYRDFYAATKPLETFDAVTLLQDSRTKAWYCECHISATKLIALATTDVPLDPDEQPEYRANRNLVENDPAFVYMKNDALKARSFSNIVMEYTIEFDAKHPLKIIGGQHRFHAIKEALAKSVNEYHGVKVYFGLDKEQRLDAQMISNTIIDISTDLIDRMQETVNGPQLRAWCQQVGLLPQNEDFADRRILGRALAVRDARTFIVNYYLGQEVDVDKFGSTETTPVLCRSGLPPDENWEKTRTAHKDIWTNTDLLEAGKQFANLVAAQRNAFKDKVGNSNDSAEKAMSFAVLSAWAYTAGMLSKNTVRLSRHYDLCKSKGRDPLNAATMGKARHKSDPERYRGLGTRSDKGERGRLVELFGLQAEDGNGISKNSIDRAIARFFAKQAQLEANRMDEKAKKK